MRLFQKCSDPASLVWTTREKRAKFVLSLPFIAVCSPLDWGSDIIKQFKAWYAHQLMPLSPNSTYSHISISVCQRTSTKDIAGQSATLTPDETSFNWVLPKDLSFWLLAILKALSFGFCNMYTSLQSNCSGLDIWRKYSLFICTLYIIYCHFCPSRGPCYLGATNLTTPLLCAVSLCFRQANEYTQFVILAWANPWTPP